MIAGFFLAAGYVLLPAAAPAPTMQLAASRAVKTPPPREPDKTIIARARQAAMPFSYTARRGDTLSSIAKALYGSRMLWPALWYTNRHKVRNPDVLAAGTRLRLSAWHPDKSWVAARALAAIPPPPRPRLVLPVQTAAPAPAAQPAGAPAAAPAPAIQPAQSAAAVTGTVASGSAYEACVIRAESGGNASAVNASSGAGGLYGFLPSTWQGLGFSGLPENAPVAEQQQAFQTLYAQAGRSPWITDGC